MKLSIDESLYFRRRRKIRQWIKFTIRHYFALLCLSVFLCLIFFLYVYSYWDHNSELTWKEEVKLSSGEIVYVDRYAHIYRQFADSIPWIDLPPMDMGDTDYWKVVKAALTVKDKKGTQILPTFEANEMPMLLEKNAVTGRWFIVTVSYKRVKFIDDYSEYELISGQWIKKTEVSKELFDNKVRGNLVVRVNFHGESDMSIAYKKDRLRRANPSFQCVGGKKHIHGTCFDIQSESRGDIQ